MTTLVEIFKLVTMIIGILIGAVIGFVLGALVYRNNKKKADAIVDAVK